MTVTVVGIAHHRCRERIKELGEVFTPEDYVQKMIELLPDNFLANEQSIFFEPTCGTGNIAVPVLIARIDGFIKKYRVAKAEKPTLRGLATALNLFWAVDICARNVRETRVRILRIVTEYLASTELSRSQRNAFLGHVLCTLITQIQDNDGISCLSPVGHGNALAGRTKLGLKWVADNGHRPIDFSLDWCALYHEASRRGEVPTLFFRARQFIEAQERGNCLKSYQEFEFAADLLSNAVRVGNGRRARGVA